MSPETDTSSPATLLARHAPWLLAPELGVCVVGSAALAEACRRAGLPPPATADLDLAWAPDLRAGQDLLREHGVLLETSPNNRDRGTAALRLAGRRIEITSFRGERRDVPLDRRLEDDLAARDMTVGALAWSLGDDRIRDPFGGLDDWRAHRIVPVGDVHQRVREHPVRWIRYYRRAHQWSFALDPSIRKLAPDRDLLARIPPEALAAELRAAVLRCASPGRFLLDLHEAGVLPLIVPELAGQFDGRPAGPGRYHPEVSQGLHLILCLEWLVDRWQDLSEPDRLTAAVAVLCHDLGKNTTDPAHFPAHHGHDRAGLPLVDHLLDRLPGLADAAGRRLARAVCLLHQTVRQLDALRPGSLARLYDRHFRQRAMRIDLFALAVGADSGGRLGLAGEGDRTRQQVHADLTWLRERATTVDAAALREQHPDDGAFRMALHEARARALTSGPPRPV